MVLEGDGNCKSCREREEGKGMVPFASGKVSQPCSPTCHTTEVLSDITATA